MAVDDNYREVLRKSGHEVTPGDKSEYYILTKIKDAIAGSFTPSGLTIGGLVTEVALNSSTWTALGAPLTDRNAISIQNRSGIEIKLNYDSGVSTYTGVVVPDQFERHYAITDSIVIYAKAASGTPTILIEELA